MKRTIDTNIKKVLKWAKQTHYFYVSFNFFFFFCKYSKFNFIGRYFRSKSENISNASWIHENDHFWSINWKSIKNEWKTLLPNERKVSIIGFTIFIAKLLISFITPNQTVWYPPIFRWLFDRSILVCAFRFFFSFSLYLGECKMHIQNWYNQKCFASIINKLIVKMHSYSFCVFDGSFFFLLVCAVHFD